MSANNHPYQMFGELLTRMRLKAGISNQGEFARLVNKKQQTVSRWERGESRPRDKDMPLIAKIVAVTVEDLMAAAGYIQQQAHVSFDKPLPINTLSPETFERFCQYFLEKLYPEARVHRFGDTGHKQDGLDIEVRFPDETLYTFQCKRVEAFGPGKVKKAVDSHIRDANQKYLLITRPASPSARIAIAQYKDWDIWDIEDIALRTRSLPKDEQIKLVDVFFAGQRFALLGETDAGPWLTLDEFFGPFMKGEWAFNHLWPLIGRQVESDTLHNSLKASDVAISMLIGSGGSGKSRLIYEALKKYQLENPKKLIRLLSASEELTNKSLENLGGGEKLLVVDDAHDHDDLPQIFRYAANNKNTKILLSLRGYGVDRIRNQAAAINLYGKQISKIEIKPLSIKDSKNLSEHVLKNYGGNTAYASEIARLTYDCPLATVIGSQIVSSGKIHPEFLTNEDLFRTTLLSRFKKIITDGISNNNRDSETVNKLLRIFSLIQPFDPEDKNVQLLIEKVELIKIQDFNRILKLLIDGGVIFKRGGLYKISPDVLADYIIEGSCITNNGNSTGFAEIIFDNSINIYMEHVLVNLGKLDWRRSNGNPNNSKLVDGIWNKLEPSDTFGDVHLKAMIAVAYYQPHKAIEFSEKCITDGNIFRDLPVLIRNVAYNLEFVSKACLCLWEIGKNDKRDLNPNPGHSIRILSELCAVSPNKPIEYNERVVNFFLSILDEKDAWEGRYNPYDVLKGILQTEGHTTLSNRKTFSFSPYFVRQESVSSLRKMVVNAAIHMLDSEDIRIASSSARFLQHALRYPMGLMGLSIDDSDRERWTDEFVETLEKIERKILSSVIDPIVYIDIQKTISWHARYSDGRTKDISKRIIDNIPQTLDFRVLQFLVNGHNGLEDSEVRISELQNNINCLIKSICKKYENSKNIFQYIKNLIEIINKCNTSNNYLSQNLCIGLIDKSIDFAMEVLDDHLVNGLSSMSPYSRFALARFYPDHANEGMSYIKKFIAKEEPNYHVAVANALYLIFNKISVSIENDEIFVFEELLSSRSEHVLLESINPIRGIARTNPALARKLFSKVNLGFSHHVADAALMLCTPNSAYPMESFSVDEIKNIFEKLLPLNEIQGYWVEEFISNTSKIFPIETMNFFIERVKLSAKVNDYKYRPSNYGPYLNVPLKFREANEFFQIIHELWNWIRLESIENIKFNYHSSKLFDMLFWPLDESLLQFLREKIQGDSLDIKIVDMLLRDAPEDFCFKEYLFVIDYLIASKSHGKEFHSISINALYSSATTGMRSGVYGEPFQRDIDAKNESEKILSELSLSSPAYHLYDLIKKNAEWNISKSKVDDDMDGD